MHPRFLLILVLCASTTTLSAQDKLTVEGNASIQGILKLIFGNDNIVVGLNAGTDLNGGTDNTFVGEKAGNKTTTGSDNVFLGNDAGRFNTTGSGNVFLGGDAGENSTTATGNVAIGRSALLQNTTESGLVAIGDSALFNNTTGSWNTANGYQVLSSNTTGSRNTGNGYQALLHNTTGSVNTATGAFALAANTIGSENTANGYQALANSTSGSFNTATGYFALSTNTTGSENTAIGKNALFLNVSGGENSALGFSAYSTSTSFNNSTALGYDAEPGASNTIRLGNDAVTTIGGMVDFTVTSDARFKTKVLEDVPGIAFIESLRPVTYHLDWQAMDDWRAEYLGERDSSDYAEKRDIEKIKFTGFLAQEVEAAAQEMGYDFSGVDAPDTDQQAYGLRYATFVVPLVKATQELHEDLKQKTEEIQNLKSEVRDQKLVNERLQNELDELRSMMEQMIGSQKDEAPVILHQSPYLDQNQPNPTSGTTRVGYFLPQGKTGELVITAIDGKELQRIMLTQKGKGQVDLQTRNLPAGTYHYSLVVDGQIVDTKRMILQK